MSEEEKIESFKNNLLHLIEQKNIERNQFNPLGLIVAPGVGNIFRSFFNFNPDLPGDEEIIGNDYYSIGILFLNEYELKIYIDEDKAPTNIFILYPNTNKKIGGLDLFNLNLN